MPIESGTARPQRLGATAAALIALGAAACEDPLPPVACGTIPRVTLNASETATFNACFNDPNGDEMSFSAASSNPGVAAASISGAVLTVRAVAPGNASVTVTATDAGGLQGNQSFQVEVPNRAPLSRGSIPSLTIAVGGRETVDASIYFTEPDGETLVYGATSSDPAVAAVSVSGAAVAVTAVARGATHVTLTATDPGGLEATQTFRVTVPNRPPAPVGTIPDDTVEVGEPATVDLAAYFDDPDGDTLSYRATSTSSGVVSASVSGGVLTVAAVARGTATVVVIAVDPELLSATQSFQVTVPNRPPAPVGAIPDDTVWVGESVTVDMAAYFNDPDGDALTYSASSSDSGVAVVSVSEAIATIGGVEAGGATITLTARDPDGLTATQRAAVTVTRENRAPRPVGRISPRRMAPGDTVAIDVSRHFEDPDGDTLAYAASSSDTGVARVSVSGSTVAIAAVAIGSATIATTAADPGGLAAESAFEITVDSLPTGLFRVDLVLATDMTLSQEEAFQDAAALWMRILSATELEDVELDGPIGCAGEYEQHVDTIDDLMIVAAVIAIDGPGGVLGRAGPCWIRNTDLLPLFGIMEFDEADLENLEDDGLLTPVILHEMAHVLGFGTLWPRHGLLRNASSAFQALDTHFAGDLAIESFDSAGGEDYTGGAKVPVENRGGSGTRNGHWRASVFGRELMIGYIGSIPPLSAITIQSLADMGYEVDAELADGYSLPDAEALESALENAVHLGNDIIDVPIVVVGADGRVVRVIRPG